MLYFHSSEAMAHLEKVRKFADSLGNEARASLERCIERYGADTVVDKQLSLWKDGSFQQEYNFGFTVSKRENLGMPNEWGKWVQWYSGGIIFDKNNNRWESHT